VQSEGEEEEEEEEEVEKPAEPPPKEVGLAVKVGAAIGALAAVLLGVKVAAAGKARRRTKVVTTVQRWWTDVQKNGMSDAEFSLTEAFGALDENGDGTLVPDEIRHVLTTSGEAPLSADSVEALVNLVDVDGDGSISYAEFDDYFSSSFFVMPGDTLTDISLRLTRSDKYWEALAEHNHLLDDPRRLRAGTLLRIPEEMMQEIMTERGLNASTSATKGSRRAILAGGDPFGLG